MKISWAYVAGFWDGEGSFTVGVDVFLATASQAGLIGKLVLSEISEFLTEEGIHSKVRLAGRAGRGLRTKDGYMISIHRRDDVQRFCQRVVPHLRVKKAAAQDFLRYFKLYPRLKSVRSFGSEIQDRRSDRRKPTAVCVTCGVEFTRLCPQRRAVTCSRKCQDALMWKTRRDIQQASTQPIN